MKTDARGKGVCVSHLPPVSLSGIRTSFVGIFDLITQAHFGRAPL